MAHSIIIRDNHEPLVDVTKICKGVAFSLNKERIRIEKTVYLRETVAKMIRAAQKELPRGWNFTIGDAWRPAYVQAKIFFWFIKKTKEKNPAWTHARVLREVNIYVAPWKGINASGHMSGGAVDLRLINRFGHKVPMKSRALSYQENALSKQKLLPPHIRKNREILFAALRAGGLSNYPKEYWHWSYGDYQWAKRNGRKIAHYGAVQAHGDFYQNLPCPCGREKIFEECHRKT